ncbi:DUF1217 domain-containing protein [Falsiroseomonas sp. CW058]|uniref:DUF1217 domain-containing protein n=1 Tax=Falsiroseomonas sp. CW058 TaxID=3388664 RepID=UPI003D323245
MGPAGYLLSLFGSGDGGVPLGPGGRIGLYKSSLANAARDTERLRRDPAVLRDLARLDRAIAKAKTPEDLFKDPVVVKTLLEGLGLADQAANVGLAKQALMSDPSKAGSLAARLPDARWKAAAEQLGFAKGGLDALRTAAVRDVIANGVVEYRRVSAIGKQSRAVADALVIHKLQDGKAPDVYEVLGNKVMRRVVQTLGSLPDQLAMQGIEAQARSVEGRVRLDDLAKSATRERMIQRYLTMAEDNAPEETSFESLILKL